MQRGSGSGVSGGWTLSDSGMDASGPAASPVDRWAANRVPSCVPEAIPVHCGIRCPIHQLSAGTHRRGLSSSPVAPRGARRSRARCMARRYIMGVELTAWRYARELRMPPGQGRRACPCQARFCSRQHCWRGCVKAMQVILPVLSPGQCHRRIYGGHGETRAIVRL